MRKGGDARGRRRRIENQLDQARERVVFDDHYRSRDG
jgi:hypothetical protein